MPVNVKRAYDKPGDRDGIRVLVDGLWPRGVSKAGLEIAIWEKGIAPSKALRTWYGHDPEKWPEFRRRYREELEKSPRQELLQLLVHLAEQGTLTLVFGARDSARSNAAVVAEVIQSRLKGGQQAPTGAARRGKKASR